jgi:hypothetical protein
MLKKYDVQAYEKIYNFRTAFSLVRDDGEYSNTYVFTYCTYDCDDNEILVTADKKEIHNQMKMNYFIAVNHETYEGTKNDII